MTNIRIFDSLWSLSCSLEDMQSSRCAQPFGCAVSSDAWVSFRVFQALSSAWPTNRPSDGPHRTWRCRVWSRLAHWGTDASRCWSCGRRADCCSPLRQHFFHESQLYSDQQFFDSMPITGNEFKIKRLAPHDLCNLCDPKSIPCEQREAAVIKCLKHFSTLNGNKKNERFLEQLLATITQEELVSIATIAPFELHQDQQWASSSGTTMRTWFTSIEKHLYSVLRVSLPPNIIPKVLPATNPNFVGSTGT